MSSQPVLPGTDLDGWRGGETFDFERDSARLNRQARAVWQVMRDGEWHTLEAISIRAGVILGHGDVPQASCSARLRDFRKPRFGGHTIERRYVADGLWQYRLADEVAT